MPADGIAWKEEFAVRSFETECTGRLRMASLFNYFQEIAGNHVVNLGIGYEVLKKLGYVWVLSRARIRFNRVPSWGEKGTLETWHVQTEGLMYIRDFRMRSGTGEVLLEAATGWLLMDTTSFRPHLADVLPIPLTVNERARALDEPLRKLVPLPGVQPVYGRDVHLSDLDVNGHVNNARYLEWIFDCYDDVFVASHVPAVLQVNYVGETTLGDSVVLSRAPDPSAPSTHYIEGIQEKTGTRVVQAVVSWESLEPRGAFPVHLA